MNFLVISSSLSPSSRSRILARAAFERLRAGDNRVEYVDLKDLPLPVCDADSCYADPNVRKLSDAIRAADGIILAAPVYNYAAGSSAKNLIELTGDAWSEKVVAFLCAAGGPNSYMALMGLVNSLMLDFRTIVVPRFVFVTETDFDNGRITNAKIDARLDQLVAELVRVAGALRSV